MEYIQLSLFGRTLWERFHQTTGWILKPCWKHSQLPKFQCLLQEDGQMPAWCEEECLISAGGSWTPNIGEAPDCAKEESASFSWQILEEHAAQKYYLNPAGCSRILYLAPDGRNAAAQGNRNNFAKAGRGHPVLRAFYGRKMRQAAKEGNAGMFLQSFGDSTHAFPTLLASNPVLFAIWQEGNEAEGCIRYLTPLECERLMGLPDGWTAYGAEGDAISDRARYEALGNAGALPCADYIMAGIREALAGR